MSNRKSVFIICLCLLVMSVFAASYIAAYNLKISKELIDNEEETVTKTDAVINDNTNVMMEIYDNYTGKIYETDFDRDVNLIGKNRAQLSEYISLLNNSLDEEELNVGLLSYQLVYFSEEAVTIRKNYDTSINYCSYIIKEENGYVVVYKYPEKTLYHNTGILTLSLDEEVRLKLQEGIMIENEEKLFDLLESYSS